MTNCKSTRTPSIQLIFNSSTYFLRRFSIFHFPFSTFHFPFSILHFHFQMFSFSFFFFFHLTVSGSGPPRLCNSLPHLLSRAAILLIFSLPFAAVPRGLALLQVRPPVLFKLRRVCTSKLKPSTGNQKTK